MIQLTLTLKMTTVQAVETSVTVNNNSPIQVCKLSQVCGPISSLSAQDISFIKLAKLTTLITERGPVVATDFS